MSVKKIEISLPLCYEPQGIHCPVCGMKLYNPGDAIEEGFCEHVDFIYIDDEVGFIHQSKEVEGIVEEIEKSHEDEDTDDIDYIGELVDKLDSQTRFLMAVKMGGMACGPSWWTFQVCLNFEPE